MNRRGPVSHRRVSTHRPRYGTSNPPARRNAAQRGFSKPGKGLSPLASFFWATGNGTPFSGNDYKQIATPISCDKNNCFEIETRYMTMAITIPFPPLRTYTPPHINEFYYSQWCCRCVVSDGQQPINTPAGK